MYVAAPYSAILYKCRAIEVNIPYDYNDGNLSIKRVMRIHLLQKYDQNLLTLDLLGEYGIISVRGPRSMPRKLSQQIGRLI